MPVVLVIQHAMRMRVIISSSVASPVRTFFFLHYPINITIFEKKILNIKCVLIFSTTFVWNISHSKKNSPRKLCKIYIGLHVQYPLLLSEGNETWIFSMYFQKILKYQISWKFVQWKPSCSMRTDFHNFANAPESKDKTSAITRQRRRIPLLGLGFT